MSHRVGKQFLAFPGSVAVFVVFVAVIIFEVVVWVRLIGATALLPGLF